LRREELAPILRDKFHKGSTCGVEKIDEPGFENLWFVVPPAPPRTISHRLPGGSIARANRLIEQLPRYESSDDLDKIISYLFTRCEAVASSRMEGTWSTVDHVLTPGELYDETGGKSERASVLGYAHALEQEFIHAFKKGTAIFSIKLACRLHQQIMVKDPQYRGEPGQLRAPGKPGSVVFIGGLHRKEESIYNPTPPRHVKNCLSQVMEWMENQEFAEMGDAGMGMALPVRMAVAHAHFESVHPFSDGNGRVGRMLLALQMAASGFLPLYLSGFMEEQKVEYIAALQKAQKKLQYGPIVEFLCQAIISSRQEADLTKTSLLGLPKTWDSRGEFRDHSAAKRAFYFLISNPIFTVKQLQSHLGVSVPAAARAAAQLVAKKVVRERTGFGRNRVFAAEEVIELLSRRFGDPPAAALERAQILLKER